MVNEEYMKSLGLTEDQITLLMEAQNKEQEYRRLLLSEKINPLAVEAIIKTTDLSKEDLSNKDLIRVKIQAEYGDFIPKKENVQI